MVDLVQELLKLLQSILSLKMKIMSMFKFLLWLLVNKSMFQGIKKRSPNFPKSLIELTRYALRPLPARCSDPHSHSPIALRSCVCHRPTAHASDFRVIEHPLVRHRAVEHPSAVTRIAHASRSSSSATSHSALRGSANSAAALPLRTLVADAVRRLHPAGLAREVFAAAIVEHNCPFAFAKYPSFKKYHKSLNPDAPMISRNTLVSDINKLYLKEKNKLKRVLTSIPNRICLTSDLWTACTTE
nr:zinc finger BED domain-containing protein RICESLEEPER 2-like [Ipomoea batatas]